MAKKRANGEGNIRKRKDGRWEGRYTAGYDEKTGKRLIKNVLGKTQAEVKEKLAKAVAEAESVDVRRSDEYTLGTWLQTWDELFAKPHLRFGENARALRREKHLSQEELSEMVFTTQKYISCIETGRAHPSLEVCLRIADALHVSIDTLLKGIIETGSEVLKPNSPEQDLLDDVIWAVHRYLENR